MDNITFQKMKSIVGQADGLQSWIRRINQILSILGSENPGTTNLMIGVGTNGRMENKWMYIPPSTYEIFADALYQWRSQIEKEFEALEIEKGETDG